MSPTYELGSGYAASLSIFPARNVGLVDKLIAALTVGEEPSRSLRVQGTKDIWEMSWSGDGRATFRYGPERRAGETHVIWLRVGGQEIFSRPE
jgi:hypothetical protein